MNIDIYASLKRIAWAYGCAKRDSKEEADLKKLLLAKAEVELDKTLPAGLTRTYDDIPW